MRILQWAGILLAATSLLATGSVRGESQPTASRLIIGADISALPSLERFGAVYRDGGKPGDALKILSALGCNLYRVRLFVNPDPRFARTGGAVQDLAYVIALAKRIKASGGQFMLDIHYADNWADPGHQPTPRAWQNLEFPAMEKQVHDYTRDVLKACAAASVTPDIVQVGNEITAGILWPTAQLDKAQGPQEHEQWRKFARLLNAGCSAVREQSTPATPIRIVLHVDGGGRDVPVWFFQKLSQTPVDFDIIGLSFYPAWRDSIDQLKQNMSDLIRAYNKDILLCETSYPWKPIGVKTPAMTWPETPVGQQKFLQDLTQALRADPNGHGLGYVWWYPEAIPLKGQHIWRGGGEAWFDSQGNLLPGAEFLRAPGQ